MRVQAWAPGHATLFFSVPKASEDPQLMGSLGGGFNFSTGVVTSIKTSKIDEVYWNGSPISGEVTLTVANKMRKDHNTTQRLSIHHYSELEIGHGLSTSGAGALGTAIAINEIFNFDEDVINLYRTAHYADVINHTGLGSVMGQITGGVEIRTKVGGPGIGETMGIPADDQIIILMKDKLKTSDVLQSEEQLNLITSTGNKLIKHAKGLDKDFVREFLEIGKEFTRECGLMSTLR